MKRSVEVSPDTVSQFENKLSSFLEPHPPLTIEDCAYEFQKYPLLKVWFDRFGFTEGWDTSEIFLDLIGLCESPIEQILLLSLRVYGNRVGCIHNFIYGSQARTSLTGPPESCNDFIIESQVIIEKYRIDFRLTYKEANQSRFRTSTDPTYLAKTVLVECDGHDFHERTKIQASRDKARDRRLQTLGHSMLRFTGSEIWADPFKCAAEIYNYLQAESWLFQGMERASKKNLEEAKKMKEVDTFLETLKPA
jgi:hypothetical protein